VKKRRMIFFHSVPMLRFLLLLALALPLTAQETLMRQVFDAKTDTHVEVLALFTKPSPGGYFPVRVKIANNLKGDRSIRLDFDSGQGYGGGLQAKSSFSFTAGAGKSVTRDIMVPLQPPNGYYGNSMVSIRLSGSLGTANGYCHSNFGPDQPVVLLSEALFTPNASTLDAEIRSKSGGSYRGGSEFAAKFDPKQLPDDWLAFSGYDSLILTDDDWTSIPPGARNAVLSWVRLGGQMIIHTPSLATRPSLGLPDSTGYGSIDITPIPTGFKLDAAALVAKVSGNPTKPLQASQRNDFKSSWPLQNHFGSQTFRYGLFIFVLVLFGILVGPVNLFVFAKSGQRHKLFITTPLISLGASLILITLIIVQDGFGGHGMRRVLMEVRPDGDVNAAYVHQEQFSRTGVLTGSRFTLGTPCTFLPTPIGTSRWARYTDSSGAKGNFNLQPADGKIGVSGDWFQSRSEHGHILSAVTPTRGRIEATNTPGSYLSTFDFPIETLYFLDAANQWHRAESIATGKPFTLVPIDVTMALPALTAEAKAFSQRNNQFLDLAKNRPGHFVAITSQAPVLGTHPGIRWKETRTVITGPVVTP
jgi:hypothetical protein